MISAMNKNNKLLWITFVLFVSLFVFAKIFTNKADRTFDPVIWTVDTSRISLLDYRFGMDERLNFQVKKSDQGWEVFKGNQEWRADNMVVRSLLTSLSRIESDRMVAKSSDFWSTYEVGAEQTAYLQVYDGQTKLGGLYPGKFNMNAQTRAATSYLRIDGDDRPEVYAVPGFLSMQLKKNASDFINKKILELKKASVQRLEMEYPGNATGYSMEKTAKGWSSESLATIDTTKINNYISSLQTVSGSVLYEGTIPEGSPYHALLKVVLDTGSEILLRALKDPSTDGQFIIINDSDKSLPALSSDRSGIYDRLFKSGDFFSVNGGQ